MSNVALTLACPPFGVGWAQQPLIAFFVVIGISGPKSDDYYLARKKEYLWLQAPPQAEVLSSDKRESLRAPRMTPTPRPKSFWGHPRAPDKILGEQIGGQGGWGSNSGPHGGLYLTPTPRRAIFSPKILSGAHGRPQKSSGRGVGVIWGARNLGFARRSWQDPA